ncbi:hypothetical protein M5D96_002617, partial [Drosophila gunungcola]
MRNASFIRLKLYFYSTNLINIPKSADIREFESLQLSPKLGQQANKSTTWHSFKLQRLFIVYKFQSAIFYFCDEQ